ncbi:unnamed protein product, partial [Mesorhabditis spiculigera]
MAMPPAFFYLCASYAVLLVCFMGFGELLLWRKPSPDEQAQQDNIGRLIRTSYDDLGSMTFAEKSVMSWFGVLVLLWATRDLGFVRGWGDLLFAPDHAKMLTESVSGIVVVYVMFLWPKYGFGDEQRSRRPLKANENDRILTWPIITEKLSWSIIILVGCGFCISEGVTASGLSKMVEGFVRGMHDVNPLIVQAILMAVVVAMTNFMSNSGTANIFVPLAMDAAKGLNWHPYRLGLLAAIGPSLAFMLPMATPSNALVYDTGYISFFELFYTGALVNVFCIAVTIFSVNTWAYWVLNMKVDVWGMAPTNATMTLLNAYHKARIAKFLKSYWIIIGPILFSPLLFFGKPLQCVWCICLIASYWIAGVGPLGVTCLLPVFLFPFFGFTSAQKVVSFFFKDTSVMLFITLGMGIVVEEVNLHRRIALKMLCWVQLELDNNFNKFSQSGKAAVSSPETSSRKSSNKSQKKSSSQKPSSSKKQSSARKPGGAEQPTTTTIETNAFATDAQKSQERLDKAEIVRKNLAALLQLVAAFSGFRKAMILACSHASLIGGTAIITSTGPNLIFKGELETRSHSQDNHPPFFPIELHVSYFQWAAMAIPPAFLYLVASYAVLIVCFCGCGELLLWRKPGAEEHRQQLNIRAIIHNSYEDLGPMTFAETSVMSWFGVLVLLWATRDLGFIPGWGDLIFEPTHAKMMTESVAGIVVLYVMFLWPRYGFGDEQRTNENDRILTWALIQQKLSWSIIMLVGCGFCISEAVKGSGLAKEVELLVRGLSGIHPIMVQLILLTAVVAMTEFMSNAGTANIFVPLSMEAAKGLNWHPFRLGLPAAIGPSLAFMLPMATPPNALVYDTGYISFFELFYTGGVLNIFCIAVTIVNMNTWAYWLLNMNVDIWAIATSMTPTNATTMAPINATTTAAPSVAQFDL